MKETSVLFVDDEANVLTSIKRSFATESYDVATANSADEAMAILAKYPIKVVLSDQRMPDMMGVDLLRQIKEKHPDVVRILFTGYADLNSAEKAINVSEVYRFLNKPWDSDELKAVVKGAIHHYDLVTENSRLLDETTAKNKELGEANRKLQIMYEIQKEFSSTLSHELRTPLSSIKAGIDIVMSGTAGQVSDDQKMFLTKAKENVDRLNRLINDILDLASLESGKTSLYIRNGDLNKAVHSVAQAQEAVAKTKGLYLKAELDQGIPVVAFDSDKIIQVLNNLVSNAMKFTEKGGITVISKYRPDLKQVEVRIKDTGPGISETDVAKLFHKFQQLGDPALRKTGGTGLGLAICQEIVRQHGGKISVESKQGEGSSFFFLLPVS